MSVLSVPAGYSKESRHLLTVGTSEAVLPTPTATKVKKAEKIFVQADTANSVNIIIGETGVLSNLTAGGFQLAPGANMTLPDNNYAKYFAIASSAAQKLLVTYMQDIT